MVLSTALLPYKAFHDGKHKADASVTVIMSQDWNMAFACSRLLPAWNYFSLTSLVVLMFKTELHVGRMDNQWATDYKMRSKDDWISESQGQGYLRVPVSFNFLIWGLFA